MADSQKTEFIKSFKKTALEFGELLKANRFEEAFDVAMRLNNLVKSGELDDMSKNEQAKYGLVEIQESLRKYWFLNSEMRKFQGALRKRGEKLIEAANTK